MRLKVLIIGAGLIGTTTAYFLRKRGHEVTVIDREEGPGRETSFANGSLLTPSMPEPWNAPGCWRVLLGSLGRSDAPLQLRFTTLPSLMSWGARFLRNSKASAFERNTRSNLRLAVHSLDVMRRLREETRLEYGRTARGSLKIFRDPAALDRASVAADQLVAHGLTFRRLSRDETVALEPALAPVASRLAGALHYPLDETGDAYRFCVALANQARELGVEFRFRTELSALEARSGQVAAVIAGERLTADRIVIAAGSYTTPLLRRAGLRLPVAPAKGYSVTFPALSHQPPLAIPVIDDDLHAAVVPIEGAVRVAGTAEFAGFDRTLSPVRIENLTRLLREVLPQAQYDPATVKPWCGLRPMSADGVPLIGPTAIPNLWVSTAHGHLGWTPAAGSGQLLADLISGVSPSIDPAPYAPARFR